MHADNIGVVPLSTEIVFARARKTHRQAARLRPHARVRIILLRASTPLEDVNAWR